MTSVLGRARMVGGVTFLVLSFTLLSSARAQQKEPEKPAENVIVIPPNGTEFFRDLLMKNALEPLNGPQRYLEQPEKTVLVVFGSTQFLDDQGEAVRHFLALGGKLLVCSDRKSGPGLKNLLNIEIVGTKLRAGNNRDGYLDDPDLPYLKPLFHDGWRRDPQSPSKLFIDQGFLPGAGEGKVATNYPTSLRHDPPFFNVNHTIEELAGYPNGTRFRVRRLEFDPKQDFAALGGRYGRGHYLVLGDQDIFSNIMMVQPLQNPDFAGSLASWLREGEGVPRTRCLFIEDNSMQTKFNLFPDDLPWHVKVNYFLDQHANKMIYELEQKDFWNKAILGQDRGRFRYVLRGILFGLLTTVLLYGFFWMWKRRHRIDHTIREASHVIARIPGGGALQQRHEALLESGNLFEAFRARIRERFLAIGGGPDVEGRPPRIEIDESVDDARSVRKRVLDLWDIAFAGKTIPVKANDWDAANNRLRRVLEESLDGRWRFEPLVTTT